MGSLSGERSISGSGSTSASFFVHPASPSFDGSPAAVPHGVVPASQTRAAPGTAAWQSPTQHDGACDCAEASRPRSSAFSCFTRWSSAATSCCCLAARKLPNLTTSSKLVALAWPPSPGIECRRRRVSFNARLSRRAEASRSTTSANVASSMPSSGDNKLVTFNGPDPPFQLACGHVSQRVLLEGLLKVSAWLIKSLCSKTKDSRLFSSPGAACTGSAMTSSSSKLSSPLPPSSSSMEKVKTRLRGSSAAGAAATFCPPWSGA
mmetsp:Transcript_32142/g.88827  ORF Transcript_32142/g.88827 Transcript_32142/m.88827 type:complete len:263 (+) Transcript_32142:515-1303(+)